MANVQATLKSVKKGLVLQRTPKKGHACQKLPDHKFNIVQVSQMQYWAKWLNSYRPILKFKKTWGLLLFYCAAMYIACVLSCHCIQNLKVQFNIYRHIQVSKPILLSDSIALHLLIGAFPINLGLHQE